MDRIDTNALTSLDGRRALVTGGGSGIGRATAVLLGAAGASVLVLDRVGESARKTADSIRETGGRAEAVEADVSNYNAVDDALQSALNSGLSILVNAAGIVLRKDLRGTNPDEWAKVIEVNLTGYYNVLRLCLPALEQSGSGVVVQIASMNALIGNGYPAYTASKGAIISMTRQLAGELGPRGVRINSVSPGLVETAINRETLGQQSIRNVAIANTPLGRLGDPIEVAKVVLFLVSPLASFVTGIDVLVDGGLISSLHWGSVQPILQPTDLPDKA